MGEVLLHAVDPLRWEYYQDVQRSGKQVSPQTMIEAYRRTMNPEWEGPTPGEKRGAEIAQWMKYPGSAAGGILGSRVGTTGALAGKAAGWMIPDLISMYLNPETANRSALLDVAEYAGGKVLGTAAGRGYRSLVQPALASRGLLSKAEHPILARAIPLVEQVLLEPATGPGAPKKPVGVPKKMGKWLRSKGPQGVEPEGAFRLTQARRVPWTGEVQGTLRVPQVARQAGIPGTEARTLAATRMRGRGLPQYPGGAVSVPPPSAQGSLALPSYQLPLPGGSSVTLTPAVRGASSRTPHAGLGVPSLAAPKSGLVAEAMRSLPLVPERTPLVGEVLWGEQRVVTNPFKKVFNFPIGYQLGKGGTRAVRPKSPFNFPKGYQLGKGGTRAVRPKSPFNFPKGYQLGKGSTRTVVSPFNFPKGYQLGKGSTRTVVSPFNFPKGYQLGKGGTQIEVRRVRGER
jgi:hypothetical protein